MFYKNNENTLCFKGNWWESLYENQYFVANRQSGPGALIPRMRITFCGLGCKIDENPCMRIIILKIEKTTRSGTQVGQNETSVTRREASKSESQKKSETTVTPREAPCEILFLSLDDFCAPAWQGGKLQKVNFKHRSKKPHSLKWYPVKHESAQQQKTHFGTY